MQPVMMPGEAVLTVMERTERQLGTPSAERGFAHRVGHHEQHFLGGAADGGNHHDAQRHAAGKGGEVPGGTTISE